MSRLSFTTFCIELYSQHTQISSEKIYSLFESSGLLKLLQDDYEDLHGMGTDYLMKFCDDYLKSIAVVPSSVIEHALVKATIIPAVVGMIQEKYNLSENEALKKFYTSRIAKHLSDESTGLYGQSPLHIFGLFLAEQENT